MTTSTGDAPAKYEIRALTGLRAVAATWVVVYHLWGGTPGRQWAPVTDLVKPLFHYGWLGVDLFFVLSGFVLCRNYVRTMGPRPDLRSTLSFYRNRLSRVWPLWAVITIAFTGWLVIKHLTIGGNHLHGMLRPRVGIWPLAQQLLLVQVWGRPDFSSSSTVAAGWSLSAEWAAYVAFPLLVLVLYRLRRLPTALLGAAALLALVPFIHHCWTAPTLDFPWAWAWRIGGAFVAGALTSLCVDKLQTSARVRTMAPVVASAGLAELVVVCWWAELNGQNVTLAILIFPILIGSLALSERGPARWLSKPWMVLGGRLSFALYLVHLCIFEVFWTAMDVVPQFHADSPWVALVLPAVFVLPFPCAYLLWRYVEEPARLWIRDARIPSQFGRRTAKPGADVVGYRRIIGVAPAHGEKAVVTSLLPAPAAGPSIDEPVHAGS